MESKWRFNVYDLGLSLGTVRLAARLLDDPTVVLAATTATDGRWIKLRESLSPNFGWQPFTFGFPDPSTPNFPYGFEVEPD